MASPKIRDTRIDADAINGLMKEGVIGILLLSVVLLLFLGNYRATFIVALSIPLSVMFVFIGLFFTGDSINSMTLGGIALAIGLLVDTSIVVLENIDKHLQQGKSPAASAYDGAKEVAMPVLVAAITIIIVFFPIVFLTGIAKYLFPPLAISVSLAIIGSLIFAMTLVPVAAAALFKAHSSEQQPKGVLARFQSKLVGLTQRYSGWKEGYQTPTAEYTRRLRRKLKEQFPGVQFIFNTSGLVTAALNFGLPSPIDIQIIGNDLYTAHEIAQKVRRMVRNVEGTEDVRIQQRVDHPEIRVEIDRVKTAELGLTAESVVKNTVAALNSTVNFKPSFWIDEHNGNHYFVGVTYPEYALDDPRAVDNIAIIGSNGYGPALLKNIARTRLYYIDAIAMYDKAQCGLFVAMGNDL